MPDHSQGQNRLYCAITVRLAVQASLVPYACMGTFLGRLGTEGRSKAGTHFICYLSGSPS